LALAGGAREAVNRDSRLPPESGPIAPARADAVAPEGEFEATFGADGERMPVVGLGRVLMITGWLVFLIGLVITILSRLALGRLPGDVVVERGSFTLYFPIVTSILLSLVLSSLLWLLRR